MRDLSLFRSTAGGKAGAIDGLNLFFGALLGANLGTVQGMGLIDYVKLIFLLAGTVMVIRMLSTSTRRTYMMVNTGFYLVLLCVFLLVPTFQPKGMAQNDLHRLAATLVIWIAFVVATELMPVGKEEPSPGQTTP